MQFQSFRERHEIKRAKKCSGSCSKILAQTAIAMDRVAFVAHTAYVMLQNLKTGVRRYLVKRDRTLFGFLPVGFEDVLDDIENANQSRNFDS